MKVVAECMGCGNVNPTLATCLFFPGETHFFKLATRSELLQGECKESARRVRVECRESASRVQGHYFPGGTSLGDPNYQKKNKELCMTADQRWVIGVQ